MSAARALVGLDGPGEGEARETTIYVENLDDGDAGRCRARTGSAAELRRHLRRLRDEGLLLHAPGRLQQRVRFPSGAWERWYVVEAPYPEAVPRVQ